MRKFFYPFLPLVFFLALAELAAEKEWVSTFLFAPPSQILKSLFQDRAFFTEAFLQTAFCASAGLLMSIILGLSFALLLSFSNRVRLMFYPYAVFFQTVPIIAIAPLLVIWLGYGLPTVIASATIVSIFPVIANSVMGFLSTDIHLINLFRMLDASRVQVLFKLRVPFALPQILGGIKIAAGLSVIGAIVGEFISGTGLGGLIDVARNQQRIDRVLAAVFLAAFLGILFFGFVSFLNLIFITRWRKTP